MFGEDVTKFQSGRRVLHGLNLYIVEEKGPISLAGTFGRKVDIGLQIGSIDFDVS